MLTEKEIITTELGNVSIEVESDKYGTNYIYKDDDTIAKTGFTLPEKIAEAFMELGRRQNQKEIEELKKLNQEIINSEIEVRQRESERDLHYENLEVENEKLKQKIEKMRCCGNCKHLRFFKSINHYGCDCADSPNHSKCDGTFDWSYWELKE